MPQSHVIIHIPHCATDIPPEVRPNLLLSDRELEAEILKVTDWQTDALADGLEKYAMVIKNKYSRLVVDPERFRDDSLEIMSRAGMGAVYVSTCEGKPLRHLSAEDRKQLLQQYFDPYHEKIDAVTADILEHHNHCLIVDVHSFPSDPWPCEEDPGAVRPDICLGTDDFHTPAGLSTLAEKHFTQAGCTVVLNKPFGGTFVPGRFYRQDKSVTSVMIEINRSLYMDEKTGAKVKNFDKVKTVFQEFIKKLLVYDPT